MGHKFVLSRRIIDYQTVQHYLGTVYRQVNLTIKDRIAIIMKLITIVATLLLAATINADPTCTPTNVADYKWFSVGNTWYTVIRKKMTWAEAAVECAKAQPGRSSLAKILTKEEQAGVIEGVKVYSMVYTGGVLISQPMQPKRWFWSKNTGKENSLTEITNNDYWQPHQPSGDGPCLAVLQPHQKRRWNDLSCTIKIPALCEYRCSGCNQ